MLSAQGNWKKVYNKSDFSSFVYEVVETYDGGFMSGDGLLIPNGNWVGWLIKTDINGNVLWDKTLDGYNESPFFTVKATADGGFVIAGRYAPQLYGKQDAYVMKFNACAEAEWCTLLPEEDGEGSEAAPHTLFQLPDGGYWVERMKQVWEHGHRWSLIRLDPQGQVLWMNWYDPHTSWWAQLDQNAMITADTCMLISSIVDDTIRPDGALSYMPLLYKVDLQGNLLWQKEYYLLSPRCGSAINPTIEDAQGNFYCGGWICPWRHSVMYKFNAQGDTLGVVDYDDTIPGYQGGEINTLLWINDTTLIVGAQSFDSPNGNHWIISVSDTTGYWRTRVLEKENFIFTKTILTSDNKIVAAGVGTDNCSGMYGCFGLYKFNMDLEWDSIYTMPRRYDSLCPHAIRSDTVAMQGFCHTVGLPAPLEGTDMQQLKVYPVPARAYLTVDIPAYGATITQGSHITQQHFAPLQGRLTLQMLDQQGRAVLEQGFEAGMANQVLDVSTLPPGIYLLRLLDAKGTVATGKAIVAR